MRRLLFILPNSGGGGDNQVVLNLLNARVNDHFEIHFLVNSKGNCHNDFQKVGRVHMPLMDSVPIIRRLLRRFAVNVYKNSKKYYCGYLIKKIKPDIIYLNTVNEHEYSKRAILHRGNLVVHIHEMDTVVTLRMSNRWIHTLLGAANILITCADAVSQFYKDVYGSDLTRFRVLHGPVASGRIFNIAVEGFKSQLNCSESPMLIGASGSVIHRKGVDTFIKACALVRKSFPNKNIKYFWLGGEINPPAVHDFRYAIEKLIGDTDMQDCFTIIPYSKAVSNFYPGLDIFVLPSRIEAFPLVILEAMLFEKPVVAMDVGGVREVVDEQTGYLVKDRTPEGLAEGIIHFLQSETLRKETGKRGRERVLKNFEAEVQVKKWLQILHELTD